MPLASDRPEDLGRSPRSTGFPKALSSFFNEVIGLRVWGLGSFFAWFRVWGSFFYDASGLSWSVGVQGTIGVSRVRVI